jgi:hypothetical protein
LLSSPIGREDGAGEALTPCYHNNNVMSRSLNHSLPYEESNWLSGALLSTLLASYIRLSLFSFFCLVEILDDWNLDRSIKSYFGNKQPVFSFFRGAIEEGSCIARSSSCGGAEWDKTEKETTNSCSKDYNFNENFFLHTHTDTPTHPRFEYLQGSSRTEQAVEFSFSEYHRAEARDVASRLHDRRITKTLTNTFPPLSIRSSRGQGRSFAPSWSEDHENPN